MKTLLTAGVASMFLFLLPSRDCLAHGGQYRGPTDVVPPRPGNGGRSGPSTQPGGGIGPVTPGGAPPAPSAPTGPVTGGVPGSGVPGGARTGPRGIDLVDDLTGWEYWWEFNKDQYLRLKDAVHDGGVPTGSDEYWLGQRSNVDARDTLKPSADDVLRRILPALKKAIDSTRQRDIQSSCMVAMAKTGLEPADFDLLQLFAARLRENDQEIREVAALAIGIAGVQKRAWVDALRELALDTAAGRTACGRSEVDERTRAFAIYGLGLVAHEAPDVAQKRAILATLATLVNGDAMSARNLAVAAINAIGLLNVGADSAAERLLAEDALACLSGYYARELGPGRELLQAHVPPAVARLLGRSHPRTGEWKQTFADDLAGRGRKRTSHDIARSCVLALGQMCLPCESDRSEDTVHRDLLLKVYHEHKDQQTRFFAALALGQIGGALNRATLLREFGRTKDVEKPWLALALGVQAFTTAAAARANGLEAAPDRMVADTLRAALEERNSSALGGIAIGLGLCGALDGAAELRTLLRKYRSDDQRAGHLCIALALMGDRQSLPDLRAVVDGAVRRPVLLRQAAVALGKLGDKGVADQLLRRLDDGDQNLAKLSAIASALGFIGDRRTIEPLQQLLFDERLADLSRAFAAVALGGVGDRHRLPWNSKLAQNLNYRAAVETLTNNGTGVLDIL